jgi:hypothetical protein
LAEIAALAGVVGASREEGRMGATMKELGVGVLGSVVNVRWLYEERHISPAKHLTRHFPARHEGETYLASEAFRWKNDDP